MQWQQTQGTVGGKLLPKKLPLSEQVDLQNQP